MWWPFLAHRQVRTVIDVGGNTGQFAQLIHRLCPQARIYSFEPIPDCFRELQKTLEHIPRAMAFPLALGDVAGAAQMNCSAFTPCSSMLSGTKNLSEDYPDAAVVERVEIEVARMDDVFRSMILEPEILIKLDVQGYELSTLKGGAITLAKAALVVVEVCFFRRLYQNQPLFDDIYRALFEMGFSYRGNAEQMARKGDGRIVEADAIFERRDTL
jgi:FkbM family methyltransferase